MMIIEEFKKKKFYFKTDNVIDLLPEYKLTAKKLKELEIALAVNNFWNLIEDKRERKVYVIYGYKIK